MPMKPLMVVLALASAATVGAQQAALDRLSPEILDAVPPSARVTGEPGAMKIHRTSCRTAPMNEIRQRIVDLAVQEWAFFGFIVVD